MACLDNETATAYLRGDLEPEPAAQWAAHLAECETCRRCVRDVSALFDTVRQDLMLSHTDAPIDWRRAERVMQSRPARRPGVAFLARLRPRMLGASLVAVAVLVVLMVWARETPVSATEALRRATVAEQAAFNNVTHIIHRTVTVEERRPDGRELRRRQRVEIWQNGAERTRVRRLYDDEGRLLAGEWTRRDGSRAVYVPARAPVIERADARVPLDSANAWRWEPSIQPVIQATNGQALSLERRPGHDAYILTSANATAMGTGVIPVQLTLSARDFRPLAQTLVVSTNGITSEFVLRESAFEALPSDRVDSLRFVPEPELLPSPRPAVAVLAAPVSVPFAPPAIVDRPEGRVLDPIAMHICFVLHGLGLTLGGDAFIERTADRLSVNVTVTSELRRVVVVQRLASITNSDVVTVDVDVRGDASAPTAMVLPGWGGTPTYHRMRERLLTNLTGPHAGPTAEIVTNETIRWMLNESERLRTRAATLVRFSTDWPSDRLGHLDLDALAEWQTIVRDHAVDAGQRAEALRDRFSTLLPSSRDSSNAPDVEALTGPPDAERLIRRLAELASLQQTTLMTAFSNASAESLPPPPEVSAAQLDSTLTQIVAIASRFASPWPLGR